MKEIQKAHSVLSKNKPSIITKKKNTYLPLLLYSLKNNKICHREKIRAVPLRVQPFAPPSIHDRVSLRMKKLFYNIYKQPFSFRRTIITLPTTGNIYTISHNFLKKRVYSVLCESSTISPTSCRGYRVRTVKKGFIYRKRAQKNTDYKQKISLKKRKPIKRIYKSKRKIKGVLGKLYISSTKNNTILTLIDTNNNTKGWSCSGSLGFKNARKSTTYAAQAAAESMVKKAKIYGYTHLRLLVKGLGRGKQSCLRALSKSGLKIISLEDRTGIPYNGCRASKKRRL